MKPQNEGARLDGVGPRARLAEVERPERPRVLQ
jgi:hypothetical protein